MKLHSSILLTSCLSTSILAAPLSLNSFKETATSIARQSLFNLIPGNLQLPFGLGHAPKQIQENNNDIHHNNSTQDFGSSAATCFPALGYTKPDQLPSTLDNWWW